MNCQRAWSTLPPSPVRASLRHESGVAVAVVTPAGPVALRLHAHDLRGLPGVRCRVGVARGHVGRHAVHRPRLAWVCQPVDTVRLRDAGVHTRSGKAFVSSMRTVPFVASVGHPRRAGRCECRERVVIARGVGPVVTCCFRAPCSLRAC